MLQAGQVLGRKCLRFADLFQDLTTFHNVFTPHAEGFNNSGFRVALHNPYCQEHGIHQYMKQLQVHNLDGLNQWLKFLHLLYINKRNPMYMMTSSQLQENLDLIRHKNISSWLIPFPVVRPGYAYGPRIEIHDLSLFEIMSALQVTTVRQGFFAILQIALFGFPLENTLTKALDMTQVDVEGYMRSRLIQGKLDTLLGAFYFRDSIFLPNGDYMPNTNAAEMQMYTDILEAKDQPATLQTRINDLQSRIHNQAFLGNTTPLLQVLMNRKIYQHQDTHYNQYLRKKPHHPNQRKMGYKTYKYIMRNRAVKPLRMKTSPRLRKMKSLQDTMVQEQLNKMVLEQLKSSAVSTPASAAKPSTPAADAKPTIVDHYPEPPVAPIAVPPETPVEDFLGLYDDEDF